MIARLCFLILLAGIGSALSQEPETSPEWEEAASSLSADLEAAVGELAELRRRIAEEKPPLARKTEEIASRLRESRRRADLARTREETARSEARRHEEEITAWRQEKNYIESLLLDFEKTQLATRPSSEWELPAEPESDPSSWDRLSRSLDRLAASPGPRTTPGRVLDEEGVLVSGAFLEAGPVAWFVSEDGADSGLVASSSDLRPRVIGGTASSRMIGSIVEGRPGELPVDPTLGDALALEESESDLIGHIRQGGFWMIPILILAAVALLAALAKWLQLARIRNVPSATVEEVIRNLNRSDLAEARKAAASVRHPAASILNRACDRVEAQSGIGREDLEESLFERFLEAQSPLQRGLPLIAIASATAPLLGLLGTVTGMIETFRLINIFGTGDAKTLASGISEALVTTEFGLIVAIPALILHALLSRKVQAIKSTMEMTSMAVLNGLRFDAVARDDETSQPETASTP